LAQFSVEAVRQLLATWSGVPSDEPKELLITEAEVLRLGIEPDELSRFTVQKSRLIPTEHQLCSNCGKRKR